MGSYQDEITIEQIMQMDLKEAYENLCIIEDDLEMALSGKGKRIEDIKKVLEDIKKIREGIYFKIYIQHIIDKNYIEKPASELVLVNKRIKLDYNEFHREIEKRRALTKKILIEYYTSEKDITHER